MHLGPCFSGRTDTGMDSGFLFESCRLRLSSGGHSTWGAAWEGSQVGFSSIFLFTTQGAMTATWTTGGKA